MEAMNRGGFWPDGDPRLHGVALTPERLAWLHSVLAHGGHDLFLRERIIQLLDSHRALTDGELDVILADALAEPDHWYYSAPALTNALFERGRRDDAVALALAVAPSAGEEFRPHDCGLLTFAPDMRTLERACELGALPEAEAIAAALGGAGA
ncbi:hypothetical protein G7085_08675 [Tessaracoccus sp. HDW20]|uniref:hypothetical protein n=1 Tax=Tessaracoccus coleopterorum TaxID=2714950 RepID=UPI0018D3EC41|nr:hypothetical protein [Tessaracoccus coleopterorum]NHB84662.1 hypothetical protein [Tessaracoccus coleopterorum]